MTPKHPSSPEKFDAYVQSYEALHASSIAASGEDPSYFHDYKINCLTRHGVGSADAILDYGCGIGNLTERFIRLTHSVAAYDPSLKSIEACRQRVPSVVFYGQGLDIPPASFDVVVLSGVLHHIPRHERQSIMLHVLSCIKPGGHVYIFEHNPLNPYTRRVIRDCPFDDDADTMMAGQIATLVSAGGFTQIVSEYIVFFPRALAFLRPIEPILSWCPFGAQTLTIGARSKTL